MGIRFVKGNFVDCMKIIKQKNESKKIGTCCICGSTDVLVTVDHVPTKTIFVKPRPKNTITVDACEECNGGASSHDQNFGVYVSMHAVTEHEKAEELFLTNTLATLNSNKKLKRHILSTAKPVYLTTKSGIIYDKAEAVLWDSESYNAVMERIVRGLYFNHYKEILGDKAKIKIYMFRAFPPKILENIAMFRHNEIGHKGELIYKYLRAEESPLHSIWLFQFYNSLFAGAWTTPV